MSDPKGWDNAFTAKSPYGTVKGSPSYAGALSFMRRRYSQDLEGVDVRKLWARIRFIRFPSPGRDSKHMIRFDLMQQEGARRIA